MSQEMKTCVFAMSCELNSPDIASARRSSANRRGPVALYLFFAMMCRVLAISWAPKSCMFCRADSSSVCNDYVSALGGIPRGFFRTWRKAVTTSTWLNSASCVKTKSQSSLVSLILITCLFRSMLNCLLTVSVMLKVCISISLPTPFLVSTGVCVLLPLKLSVDQSSRS